MPLNQIQNRTLLKPFFTYFAIPVVFLLLTFTGNSQNSFLSGWNIGAKVGASRMIGEFPKDFSKGITEFDYKFGFAIDGELSKFIGNRWELGLDINHSILKGESDILSFSAQGNHAEFMKPLTGPVEFDNQLLGQKFFFRYYFKDLAGQKEGHSFNPFIRAGAGFLNYSSKFKYIDAPDDELIFGKGHNNNYLSLSTAVFLLGTGFQTKLTQKLYLSFNVDFNFVSYDFLDVVHNYNTEGDRLELVGIYSDFKIGVFYKLSGYKPGKGRSKKSAIQQYLPFGR